MSDPLRWSDLKPDDTKKKRRASYPKKIYKKPKILLVSTLDGKLRALDLHSGKVLWTVVPPNHISCVFPYLNLFRRGKPIQIIPSLNGDLYQFDGQCLQSRPIVTAEYLIKSECKFFDDVEISGFREIQTILLKVSTGEFITTGVEKEKKDLLEITRGIYHVIVKGTSSKTEEHFQIVQYEISDSKAGSYHLRELELSFIVPAGKVHYNIKQNNKTYELDNPIVSAWQVNGRSHATAINVFSSQQRELNSPVKHLTPSFYLGQFNKIVYIQNLLMDSSKQISISAKEISFDIAYPASGYNIMSSSFLVEKTICFDILLSIMLAQETNERSLTMPPSSDDYKTTNKLLNYHRSISEPNESSPVSTNFKSNFSSQFDIIGCLGYGGFGIVFEVMGKLDMKKYAVKRIPTKEKSQNRILREVKTLSQCEHLNIIRYYSAWYEEASADCEDPAIQKAIQGLSSYDDCTSSDSDKTRTSCSDFSRQTEKTSVQNKNVKKLYLFIQMELCHSQSLKTYIENNSVAQRNPYVNSIIKQIADGVHYIHQQRLIHRDLKPGNIFFSLDRQIVKIGDFGLVTDIPNNSGNPTNQSTSEDAQSKDVGTDLYMSPEQKAGKPYDSKVDIFSMGVIYVELLSDFDTEMERCKTLSNLKIAVIPRKFSKNLILKRMLTKNKDERPDMVEIQKLLNDDCRHGKKCNLPIRLMIDSLISNMGILLLSNVDQSQ